MKNENVDGVRVLRFDLKEEFRDFPLHEIRMDMLNESMLEMLRGYPEASIFIQDGDEDWQKKVLNLGWFVDNNEKWVESIDY